MYMQIKSSFLFSMFTLFMCLNVLFLTGTEAQVDDPPVDAPDTTEYTYESIEVPGVDFLELTASSDFEDYAGNTRSPDGEKTVGWTLIDGVFTTYAFPGAKNTYFYALGNNGNAAGHYEDSEGMFHGVILEDGELRQYDFPEAVQTFIYGISDATGALTGNFIDSQGVRRGFSGDEIIEYPGASETYADFVNGFGSVVGSYVDAEGTYQAYIRFPDGRFVSLAFKEEVVLEYFFVHGLNDERVRVARSKAVGDVPRTYVGKYQFELQELQFPGSVSTEGWNINQDGSVVGHYDTPDGRRYGFIARPVAGTEAPVETEPGIPPADLTSYTYESIDVPGVDFLAVTASSDFEDYAGNTRSAGGEKSLAFMLIDGVFTTYDFPGSKNTYFYALGNNGNAAGHYEDSEGLYHGVILEDGELRQYDFPNAVQTEIYGISDATGALTGNFIDAEGVRRGFSGDTIIEYPEATATYASFVDTSGRVVGTYIDAEGVYHGYVRFSGGEFTSIDFPGIAALESVFIPGINDVGVGVIQVKVLGSPLTFVGSIHHGLHVLRFPGSVSTEGWNINQDGSIIGHYDSPDGRRHGFIARPTSQAESEAFANTYTVTLSKGLNMLSVPLSPPTPMTAKELVALTGATAIITFDTASQQFIAWTPAAPDAGFPIEGGKGYIVNVPVPRNFAFVGAAWTHQMEAAAAPPALSTESPQAAWAFVVNGHLAGSSAFDGYTVSVRNLRTNTTLTSTVQGDYFAAATADLTRRSVVQVGDVLHVHVLGPDGNAESQTHTFKVAPEHLANAVLSVRLDNIGRPRQPQLLQNYPNPFNPETWIPYQLAEATPVSINIYDTSGRLVRTLSLGYQTAGFYNSRERAAYWDGRNSLGERVASGVYFYQLTTPTFQQTRRLVIIE